MAAKDKQKAGQEGIKTFLKEADVSLKKLEEKFLQLFGPEIDWSSSTRQLKRLC